MAAFSNIPELGVAEILSGTMGGLVGSLGGKALDTVSKLKEKLVELCEKASEGDTSVLDEIDKINSTLDVIEKTIDSLDLSLGTIEKTAAALEIPLTVLDITLKIAKMIPAPIPPPIVVLISMLSELIAQIKQIVSAMKAVAKSLRQILDMIRKLLKRLRQMIQAIKASLSLLSAGSNTALENKGVINGDGTNIFGDVGKAIGTDGTSLISIGGAEIDQNMSTGSGDWISTVYKQDYTRPDPPTSRDFQPTGWTLAEPTTDEMADSALNTAAEASTSIAIYRSGSYLYNREREREARENPQPVPEPKQYWWYTKATISGETDKVNGTWSTPERYLGAGSMGDDLSGLTDLKTSDSGSGGRPEGTITPEDFLEGSYGKDGAILALDNPEEAYDFLVDLVGVVGAAGISLEGQDEFRKTFGEQVMDGTKHYYTAPNGDKLELVVVVDPKSPSIAPLYYVTATDLRTKTIVYTGTKTFATDEEVLIREAEVRLDRIFL